MATTANTAKFTKTVSISRFKQLMGINKINIVKNPNTGKVFFTSPDDSDIRGTVAIEIDYTKDLMISTLVNEEDGVTFYMLHNAGNNTANVLQTL